MSYIPTILINLDSLLEKAEEVQKMYYDKIGQETSEAIAIETLQKDIEFNEELIRNKHDFSSSTFKSCGLRFTSISTETSNQNSELRFLLDELEVEYALDN